MNKLFCTSTVFLLAATVVLVAGPALDAKAEPQLELRPALASKHLDAPAGTKALDPAMRSDKACVIMTIACNTTVTGVLDTTDCQLDFDDTRIDFWDFQGDVGATVTINLSSNDFDTYLFLLDPDLEDVVQDDDGGGGTNSRIQRVLPVGGTWSIGANGLFPEDLGNYTLQLQCSGGTQTAPAAPSNLMATPLSSTEVELVWNDNSNNENEFRVEFMAPGAGFVDIGSVPADATLVDVTNLDPATAYGFRVRARNSVGNSAYSNVATATTSEGPGVCVPSDTNLCLLDGRFKVEVDWKDFEGVTGQGMVVPFGSADSGLFYFFDADNWEMLVKMVDACSSPFNSFWVFAAATTNVEYTLRVTDTERGVIQPYFNPLGNAAAAITDTAAFATCP